MFETPKQITTQCQRCDETEITTFFIRTLRTHSFRPSLFDSLVKLSPIQKTADGWDLSELDSTQWEQNTSRLRWHLNGVRFKQPAKAAQQRDKKTSRDWSSVIRQRTQAFIIKISNRVVILQIQSMARNSSTNDVWYTVPPRMSLIVERVCVTATPVLSLSPTECVIDHWELRWQAMEVSRVWMKLWKTARAMGGMYDSPLCTGRRDERHLSGGEVWAEVLCSTTEQPRCESCAL